MHLVSWNIQWGKGCDGRVDLERIVDTALAMGPVDVLCFQEVAVHFPVLDGGRGEDQPATFWSLLPEWEIIFRPAVDVRAPDGGKRQFGNLIASRLPVLQTQMHLLPRPAEQGGRSMQRQMVEAVIESGFGPVRVATTHVEYYSAHHQAAQVERLRQLHHEAAQRALHPDAPDVSEGPYHTVPRPAAAILCGDFNFEPSNALHAALTAPFDDGTPAYDDAWRVTHPGQRHAPTCGIHDKAQWPGPPHCRDFVFVTTDLTPRVARVIVDEATDASDHQPVLIELR